MAVKVPCSESEKKYSDYISDHMRRIRRLYTEYSGDILKELKGCTSGELARRVKEHDLSKYSEEEFSGYCQYYYPEEGEEPDKEKMERAWEHHYRVNDHHPEYWSGRAMTDGAIAEMILDWMSMSEVKGSDLRNWYHCNKEELGFNRETAKKVEKILKKGFIKEFEKKIKDNNRH